jgi:hypothetical protein
VLQRRASILRNGCAKARVADLAQRGDYLVVVLVEGAS